MCFFWKELNNMTVFLCVSRKNVEVGDSYMMLHKFVDVDCIGMDMDAGGLERYLQWAIDSCCAAVIALSYWWYKDIKARRDLKRAWKLVPTTTTAINWSNVTFLYRYNIVFILYGKYKCTYIWMFWYAKGISYMKCWD